MYSFFITAQISEFIRKTTIFKKFCDLVDQIQLLNVGKGEIYAIW